MYGSSNTPQPKPEGPLRLPSPKVMPKALPLALVSWVRYAGGNTPSAAS